GPSAVISHDELNWRVVRPNQPTDVGPIHADKWFWDAGYGYGSMPAGYDRVKIWIGVYTEPGVKGLTVKPDSHRSNHWAGHLGGRGRRLELRTRNGDTGAGHARVQVAVGGLHPGVLPLGQPAVGRPGVRPRPVRRRAGAGAVGAARVPHALGHRDAARPVPGRP